MFTMPRERLLEIHAEMTQHAIDLMKLKNADYGATTDALANFRLTEVFFGIPMIDGILCRLCDKIARIGKILQSGEVNVKTETILDTLIDAINYLVILTAALEEKRIRQEPTIKEGQHV